MENIGPGSAAADPGVLSGDQGDGDGGGHGEVGDETRRGLGTRNTPSSLLKRIRTPFA